MVRVPGLNAWRDTELAAPSSPRGAWRRRAPPPPPGAPRCQRSVAVTATATGHGTSSGSARPAAGRTSVPLPVLTLEKQ